MLELGLVVLLQAAAPMSSSVDAGDVAREYDRRRGIISGEAARRRDRLRRRMVSLYKLVRGGYLEMLGGASSRAEFFERRAAASHILARDLEELTLYLREREALEAEQAGLGESTPAEVPKGAPPLAPPLGDAVLVGRFGLYRDAEAKLELYRRGVVYATRPRQHVHASAAGVVRFAGELAGAEAGAGAVVIEHAGGLYTVYAPIVELRVAPGQTVSGAAELGSAAATRLEFQVRQGTTALDPEPLVRHTGGR
jgi:murein DD-endopeptidase MepM/ murein hydrolase activator NlpD